MNLSHHLDKIHEHVPLDISKRIILNSIAPLVSVVSSPELDSHVEEAYGFDSVYMLLNYFNGCINDRDQLNDGITTISSNPNKISHSRKKSTSSNNSAHSNNSKLKTTNIRSNRKRSNSLFIRDSTQSHYIRFTKPIPDIINLKDPYDSLFNHQSLEALLKLFLKSFNSIDNSHLNANLKNFLYHKFFSFLISSNSNISPYESFNHPIVSLFSIDMTSKINTNFYDIAKNLLIDFKKLNSTTKNFPIYLSINNILPVFLLCYDASSTLQLDQAKSLQIKIKKQMFAESILLPLFNSNFNDTDVDNIELDIFDDPLITLHNPILSSSLDESLYLYQNLKKFKLRKSIISSIYDSLLRLSQNLILPFMQRKIRFWDETILQSKKTIFGSSKFFRSFMNNNNNSSSGSSYNSSYNNNNSNISPADIMENRNKNTLTLDQFGYQYLSASSPEFLLRKQADWSMMISDFKTAFTTYETLSNDLNNNNPNHYKYKASCLEWQAISILMGAQNIVTIKMIKNDVHPLIIKSLQFYEKSLLSYSDSQMTVPRRCLDSVHSYEIRCMLLLSELFLSLSDSFNSTPYAISYLMTILTDFNLGSCSKTLIWERLSFCYDLMIDPRIIKSHAQDSTDKSNSDFDCNYDIISEGLTRKRKAAFYKLIAAKHWSEQKQWTMLNWCLLDLDKIYDHEYFINNKDLLLYRLKKKLLQHQESNNETDNEKLHHKDENHSEIDNDSKVDV